MAKANPFAAFETADKAEDKKKGVKENSKADKAEDAKKGFAKGGQVSKGKQLGIDGAKKAPATKLPMTGKAKGGKICGKSAGGVMRGAGAAKKGTRFSHDG